MKKTVKLYSVTHKDVQNLPNNRHLFGVGNAVNLSNIEYKDNTGDNISDKNKNYCELTALYWIWKNSDGDYIGFEHYRRFFCRTTFFEAHVLSLKAIQKKLEKSDVILPKKFKAYPSVYGHYCNSHYKEDLDICLEIINNDYPEFAEAAKAVMQSKRLSLFNMFIMSKQLVNEYCEWLFDILFKAEKLIDISGRDDYQSRVFGFLSERLFNIWIYKKNLKICYSRVYNVGDCPIKLKIKGVLQKFKRN